MSIPTVSASVMLEDMVDRVKDEDFGKGPSTPQPPPVVLRGSILPIGCVRST